MYCLWPPRPPRGEESPCTTASHWRQKQIFFGSFHTSCANRAQLATAWSTRDTCTVCGHPTMSNYFTIYNIVAVLAFAYRSGYHCYYLSDYKLGVHVYCLWPPHYYKLESPWMTDSHWRQKQFFFGSFHI